jgi:hypothetical protein
MMLGFLLFSILPIFLATGCGGGSSPEPTGTETTASASSDTGSASFAIQWQTSSAGSASAAASGVVRQAIESCESAGVASITCKVYDPDHNQIAEGGPWDCSAHQGTIGQIPAGSDRIFAVLGWSGAGGEGNAIYHGTRSGISITAGQTTNAGTIDANPFVPGAPQPSAVYGNRIELSWNDLGAAGYRIYRGGAAVGDSSTPAYSDPGLAPVTQYCYTVSALDGLGNESGQSGQTCTETLNEGENIFYRDADADNYGDPGDSTRAAVAPNGYVADKTDCNDNNGAIHPGAEEIFDQIDNDCDGQTDEGFIVYYRDADNDNYGNPSITTHATSQPAGYVANNTDCNDNNGAIHPGAQEVCNQIDDDCDNSIDEGVQSTFYRDADNDTYGGTSQTTQACSAPSGYVGNNTDCNDGNAAIHPNANETCNGIDDNCNNQADEGLDFRNFYADTDDDGYGDPGANVYECAQPTGYVANNGDCNDDNPDISPGQREICYDKIDNNCDGQIDQNCQVIILGPTSSFTARLIFGENVLVGDAIIQEGNPFNSTSLFIKEGTSDRLCLEFNLTTQPVPSRVTLDFQMSNIDAPTTSDISLFGYNANGLANAEDYYQVSPSERIITFSDNGAGGRNTYSLDVTSAYLESIKRERSFMGILMRADGTNGRYTVYAPVLTLSY